MFDFIKSILVDFRLVWNVTYTGPLRAMRKSPRVMEMQKVNPDKLG